MGKRERAVLVVIAALAFGVASQAGAEALYVEAADDPGASSEIVPLATTPVAMTVTYPSGWSLVSLSVTPTNNTVASMFTDVISAFQFANGYQQVSTLDPCKGYWLNLQTGGQYTVTGAPVPSCDQTWPASWSLMGIPRGGTTVAQIVQNPTSNIISVFGFANGYSQATALAEGSGYWVNLNGSGRLTLTGATTPKLAVDLRRDVPVTGSTLTAISGEGRQTLQLGAAAESIVEMPPLPPAGALDARVLVAGVGTQSVPAAAQPLDYRVQLQGENLELAWDIEAVDVDRWQLVVDGVTHPLTGNGSVRLTQTPQEVWLRYMAAAPQQFALHANYPNPFNPSTTIRYELAEAAQVQLVVYDLLGQQIRSLVDLHQPAGGYAVVWDGQNENGQQVANGLYFYEIKAVSFQGTRKMMLSK